MNKASGGDGIPVELFQMIKENAVTVLYLFFYFIYFIYFFISWMPIILQYCSGFCHTLK